MFEDPDRCYRAVLSRDPRFDGWFFTAVTSTKIYCRPSCPALTPKRANVRFYPTAAAAQAAGFRACLRCRPDATPGSPEWNGRADAAARAMRMIADGVVDREGVGGLARRLGYSDRQLHRLLVAEVGTGALPLARAQRAQTARLLLETTDLAVTDVAFAAGFASVRQFNDTVRAVFARTPTALRQRARGAGPAGGGATTPGSLTLALPLRAPFAPDELLAYLGARCVPGVESAPDGGYVRSLRLPHGDGVVTLAPSATSVRATVRLDDLRDLQAAVSRCRRLLDLDADPVAVSEALGADAVLGPLARRCPGRRVPGAVDGGELAVRAVLGQQVSVSGAATVAGRLVALAGRPLRDPEGPVTHTFPDALALSELDPALVPMPGARRRALSALAGAMARGEMTIDPGTEPAELRARLSAIRGVGPWTVEYVAMRALGDPDAFMPTDLGIRRSLRHLGQSDRPSAAAALSERWRPWRAYAMAHLWAQPTAGAVPTPTRKAGVAA
ncbi:MAG TPA: AlkA N-terminal domain-containing protein [Acidimicrobiales bacterium]|nr:AlkA N-terminal domain-containing protein [Acidimicrobiales bacterium]